MKNAAYGIWVNGTGNIRVKNNVVNMNVPKKVSGKSGGTGIRVIYSTGCKVTGNTITNASKHKFKRPYRAIELIGKKAGNALTNTLKGFEKNSQIVIRSE